MAEAVRVITNATRAVTAGSPVAIVATQTLVRSVIVKPLEANTARVDLGSSAAQSFPLPTGTTWSWVALRRGEVLDLNAIYIASASGTQNVAILYEQ